MALRTGKEPRLSDFKKFGKEIKRAFSLDNDIYKWMNENTPGDALMQAVEWAKGPKLKAKPRAVTSEIAKAKRMITQAEAKTKNKGRTPARTEMSSAAGKPPAKKNKKANPGGKNKGAGPAKPKTMDEARRGVTAKRKPNVGISKKKVTSDMARKAAMKSYKRKPDAKKMTSDEARRQAMRKK